MSISSLQSNVAAGANGSAGQTPLGYQHESQSFKNKSIPGEPDVLSDISNLQKAGKNPQKQANAAKKLIGDTMGQENQMGQLEYIEAVENGNVKTKADLDRLNAELKKNGLRPGGPGPVTLAVDDALAQAASQQAGSAGMKHESPASAVVSSATYPQSQGGASPAA